MLATERYGDAHVLGVKAVRPTFRLFGSPATSWATLAFVLVTMGFSETGRWVLLSSLLLIPMLVGGWFVLRGRIAEAARERDGYTGSHPVL